MKALQDCMTKELENNVGFGVFRVTAVDDRGTTISYRTKLIMVIHGGPKLSTMRRAKMTSYKAQMQSEFTTNCQLQLDDVQTELNEAKMEKELRRIGGAHQPTSYDWTNDADHRTE